MTFVIVMGFHQIIVVMNDVKRHTYIHTIHAIISLVEEYFCVCEDFISSCTVCNNQRLIHSYILFLHKYLTIYITSSYYTGSNFII